MRVEAKDPPRRFAVGDVELAHVADVSLEPDELVTFTTASGTEFDVVRKSWGYYATPSLGGRLAEKGLRAALVQSADGSKAWILLVERGREDEFDAYLASEDMRVAAWLDGSAPGDQQIA